MLMEQIAPGLRALGFKGSGQLYTWPSDDFWALVGFQKSRTSSRDELGFTVNLSIGSKSAWAEARIGREHWIPERPTPNTRFGMPMEEQRIGMLLRARRDKWWSVLAGCDTAKLSEEVVEAIRDAVIPTILERVGTRPA
jgi:hypothetical protein